MTEREPRGHRVRIDGPVQRAQIVVGDGNDVVMNAAGDDTEALAAFARTVRDRLPELDLGPSEDIARQIAERIVAEAQEPAPDRGRLRALGNSLRAVLEGGAGGVVTAALMNLWP
ncbi:hypothetical protein [Actinomadura rayongensis]|uniref:Uncharacterized protein n=1 Tax=Actinomadura rayongensis TaxID=1429076 RepID=A0A6I4WDL3_9ACTN|nr:hypothetical protein [Actinomadura rayongensis]MXQ66345.1 hypothetical protein [Actinomadura rayongensis]